ncbi:MAG: VOC family protein [Opitutaceae bacterium]|jgi:predicted enzyme related to lactoylglutathione lyase|nr:VOC family protein [Opitutaceae bacterium]
MSTFTQLPECRRGLAAAASVAVQALALALALTAPVARAVPPAAVPSQKPGTAFLPEGRLVWHEIQTTDVEKALAFYVSVFNWTRVDAPTVKGDRPYAMLKKDDHVFAGVALLSAYGLTGPARWLSWVAVANVDECLAAVIRAGGVPEKGPANHLVGRVAFACDPAQARFALVRPHFRQPFVFQAPVTWHGLMVAGADAEKVAPFYRDVFGWGEAVVDYSLRKSLPVLTTGGMRVASVHVLPEPGPGPAAGGGGRGAEPAFLPFVQVEDLRVALARFAAGGGREVMPVETIEGFGKVVRVADPQGAGLVLFQRAGQNL